MKNKLILTVSFIVIILNSSESSAEESKLLGFEQMINDLDQVIATDKAHYKRHKKDGSPKYLHQIQQRIYPMTYGDSGNFELLLSPEEWFKIEKMSDNEFVVRVINPQNMWKQHVFEPFTIRWMITEIID